jgi:hypothetical protein
MAGRSEGSSFPRGFSLRVIQGFLTPDIANPKCIPYETIIYSPSDGAPFAF